MGGAVHQGRRCGVMSVILFVVTMIADMLGFEISGGAWCCVTMILVCDELNGRFQKKGGTK